MNDATKADMLAEIEAFADIEKRQPGDVSLKELAERLNMTPQAARVRANAMVEKGTWITCRVKDGQFWMRIWRREQ